MFQFILETFYLEMHFLSIRLVLPPFLDLVTLLLAPFSGKFVFGVNTGAQSLVPTSKTLQTSSVRSPTSKVSFLHFVDSKPSWDITMCP